MMDSRHKIVKKIQKSNIPHHGWWRGSQPNLSLVQGNMKYLVKDIFLELNEHLSKDARMCADFYSNNEHFSV